MKKFTLVLLLIFATFGLSSQDVQRAIKSLDKLGEVVFSFVQQDTDNKLIFKKLSIDKITSEGRIYAYANKETFAWFLEQNIPWRNELHTSEMEGEWTMWDYSQKSDKAWDAYPTYPSYEALMYDFAANFPEICRIDTIGILPSGRKLLSAIISDHVYQNEDEPHFLYSGTIHGDETTGYILLLRLIDQILNNYQTDERIAYLVNNTVIHINPLANPDGTFRGGNNTLALAIRFNANFVDLNRNYKDHVHGDHPDNKQWQPETIANMEYANKYPFVMAANFHGGIELVNFPWDCKYDLAADDDWWFQISKEYADSAKKYSNFDGYFTGTGDGIHPGVTNGAGWYVATGTRQDYMNYYHYCREVTLEVSNTKKPNASTMPYFWDANYPSMLNYWEEVLYGFRGIVTDSLTGEPIKAKVTLVQHDFDNSFVFSSLPIGNYHRPVIAGLYSLLFEADGYCSKLIENQNIQNKETIRIDVQMNPCPASISESSNEFVRFFPNPSDDYLFVQLKNQNHKTMIEISSLDGKIVLKEYLFLNSRLDISHLAKGFYNLRAHQQNNSTILKLIKK